MTGMVVYYKFMFLKTEAFRVNVLNMLLAFFYLVIFISCLKNKIVQCRFISNIKTQGIFIISMHVRSRKHYLQTRTSYGFNLKGILQILQSTLINTTMPPDKYEVLGLYNERSLTQGKKT